MEDRIHNFFVIRAVIMLVVVSLALVGWFIWQQYIIRQIDTFAECAARYPVMETYPEQCKANGQTFVAPTR